MPEHILNLKISSPIILLRNLNCKSGLCNGTRLKILDIKPNLLQCLIITEGKFRDRIVFIPKIKL